MPRLIIFDTGKIMLNNGLSSSCILTADIGGSHISAGVYDREGRLILPHSMVSKGVQSDGSADEILSSWAGALQGALAAINEGRIGGVSVAMPGPFDYENGISYIKGLSKYEAIYGMDIRKYLAKQLNIEPQLIKFRNDAESAIAGEALAGAGMGYHKVLGITLGTGFGSAFSEGGVTKDINLGSEPYKDSIADDHLSTRWFVRRYRELTGVAPTDGVKELASLAATDMAAGAVFKEFASNLAGFLSGYITVLEPDVLLIGGSIAKASAYFLPGLKEDLNINVRMALLGESAPLIGAASIFENNGWPV